MRKAIIIEILEQDKDKYKFMKGAFLDGGVGRCAMGAVLSRYGWNGNPDVKYLIPAQRRSGLAMEIPDIASYTN